MNKIIIVAACSIFSVVGFLSSPAFAGGTCKGRPPPENFHMKKNATYFFQADYVDNAIAAYFEGDPTLFSIGYNNGRVPDSIQRVRITTQIPKDGRLLHVIGTNEANFSSARPVPNPGEIQFQIVEVKKNGARIIRVSAACKGADNPGWLPQTFADVYFRVFRDK